MKAWPSFIDDPEDRAKAWRRYWGGWAGRGYMSRECWEWMTDEGDDRFDETKYAAEFSDKQLCDADEVQKILAFAELTPRERKVIYERFLSGADPTLEEVGLRFSVCRERIRGIEARALMRMKEVAVAMELGKPVRKRSRIADRMARDMKGE